MEGGGGTGVRKLAALGRGVSNNQCFVCGVSLCCGWSDGLFDDEHFLARTDTCDTSPSQHQPRTQSAGRSQPRNTAAATMSERKVLNKYYPPDFDPREVPRKKTAKDFKQVEIRAMLPMNVRCSTCGEFVYAGRKFNARKELAKGEEYHGIKVFRFYIKCTSCRCEIIFKTDPRNSDYIVEAGAVRNFEPWKQKEAVEQVLKEQRDREEQEDSMKALENRTLESKREIDRLGEFRRVRPLLHLAAGRTDVVVEMRLRTYLRGVCVLWSCSPDFHFRCACSLFYTDALEEIRELNKAQAKGDAPDKALERLQLQRAAEARRQQLQLESEIEAESRKFFAGMEAEGGKFVRRLADDPEDEDTGGVSLFSVRKPKSDEQQQQQQSVGEASSGVLPTLVQPPGLPGLGLVVMSKEKKSKKEKKAKKEKKEKNNKDHRKRRHADSGEAQDSAVEPAAPENSGSSIPPDDGGSTKRPKLATTAPVTVGLVLGYGSSSESSDQDE